MPHPKVDSEGHTAGLLAAALMHLKMAVCHIGEFSFEIHSVGMTLLS